MVQPVTGDRFDKKLKAMNHSDALTEVLKLSSSSDEAEAKLWSGAKVQILALVDSFVIDSKVVVTTGIKR